MHGIRAWTPGTAALTHTRQNRSWVDRPRRHMAQEGLFMATGVLFRGCGRWRPYNSPCWGHGDGELLCLAHHSRSSFAEDRGYTPSESIPAVCWSSG